MTHKIKEPSRKNFKFASDAQKIDTKEMLNIITEALLDKKAKSITLLDVSDLTSLTEYFVICHGSSDVQIKAMADAVESDVKEKLGEKVWKKEGTDNRTWIILDYVNVVVHVMSEEKRDYYAIERMWNDAKITEIADENPED